MSNEHPDDNAQSRFSAFWMIVAAFLVFIIFSLVALCFSSSGENKATNIEEDGRAEKRLENLAEVVEAQQALVNQAAVVDEANNMVRIPVKDGMRLVLPLLQNKKMGLTELVVPGSPTQLEQAKAAAAAAKKKKDAEAKTKAADKKEGDETEVKAPKKEQ